MGCLVHVIKAPFGSRISMPHFLTMTILYTGKKSFLLTQPSASGKARIRTYSFFGPGAAECDDASLRENRALDPVSRRLLPLVWTLKVDHIRIY